MAKITTLLLFLGPLVAGRAADFDEVIRNPEKFHNKRVTLVAMVEAGTKGGTRRRQGNLWTNLDRKPSL